MRDFLYFETELKDPESSWVVFLHGAGGSISTWSKQREEFKKHFNLLFIDLRDHGNSKNIDPNYDSYNFDIITSDILKVLDHLKIENASFITLSFGSVLIQSLMLQRPEVVEKCVLAGGVFSGSLRLKLFVHAARFLNLFLSFETMYSTFSKILMPLKSQAVSRRIYNLQARKLTKDEYLKWLGLYSNFFLLLRKFVSQQINIPCLVVMGEHDYMFLSGAKKFSRSKDRVKLEINSNTGHICNIDDGPTFDERVISFLVS